MAYKTDLFSSTEGDIVFPITPTSIDAVAAGANVPLASMNVGGATVLTGTVSGAGVAAAIQAVIVASAPAVRYLALTDVRADSGLPLLTATAAAAIPGIARTAGTSIALNGVATAGATPATTKMIWEFNLPSTYVAGAAIPLNVNCAVPVATNVTAASTTMTVAAYTVSAAGVEAAVTVSAAQQIPITTAATLAFSITGTGLVPGQHMVVELTMLVTTTSGGASTGQVNSVGYQA